MGACDCDGLQPLHIAASGGHLECCRLLVAAGSDPSVPDAYSGLTSQMYAMTRDGELGDALQEILGVPDLRLFAAFGDPLALAMHAATCIPCDGGLPAEAAATAGLVADAGQSPDKEGIATVATSVDLATEAGQSLNSKDKDFDAAAEA